LCTGCGGAPLLFGPRWPARVHPHAPAIDSREVRLDGVAEESLEQRHRPHGWLDEDEEEAGTR